MLEISSKVTSELMDENLHIVFMLYLMTDRLMISTFNNQNKGASRILIYSK